MDYQKYLNNCLEWSLRPLSMTDWMEWQILGWFM